VGVGTLEDPRGQEGFFHALGRAIVVTPELRDLGAGVRVLPTTTTIWMDVPSDTLETAIARLVSRLYGSDPTGLSLVEADYLDNLRNRMTLDPGLRSRWLRRLVRDPGHAFSRSPFEVGGNLSAVTSHNLAEAMGKYFFPGNTKLVVMGPQSLAHLERMVRNHFIRTDHRLPLTLSSRILRTQYPATEQLVRWQTGDTKAYLLDVVISLDPVVAGDWPNHSLDTIADYLNSPVQSELNAKLKSSRLISSYKVVVTTNQYQRDLEFQLQLTPEGYGRYNQVLQILDQVLTSIRDRGPDEAGLLAYSTARQRGREESYKTNGMNATTENANRISEGLWSYRL